MKIKGKNFTSESSEVLLWRWFISLFSREVPARPTHCAAIRGSQSSAGAKFLQSRELTFIFLCLKLSWSNGRTFIPHHLLKVRQVSHLLSSSQTQGEHQYKVLRRSDGCLMGVDFPTLSPHAGVCGASRGLWSCFGLTLTQLIIAIAALGEQGNVLLHRHIHPNGFCLTAKDRSSQIRATRTFGEPFCFRCFILSVKEPSETPISQLRVVFGEHVAGSTE